MPHSHPDSNNKICTMIKYSSAYQPSHWRSRDTVSSHKFQQFLVLRFSPYASNKDSLLWCIELPTKNRQSAANFHVEENIQMWPRVDVASVKRHIGGETGVNYNSIHKDCQSGIYIKRFCNLLGAILNASPSLMGDKITYFLKIVSSK